MSEDFVIPAWQQRAGLLYGADGLQKLSHARVLLAGAGGVGGHAADALIRSGIGHLVVFDPDSVSESNRNRQLLALASTAGQSKVGVLKERALDINPAIDFEGHAEALCEENIPAVLDAGGFDVIVDAIDSLADKCFLLAEAHRRGIFTISAMGAAGRINPALVQYADIAKTRDCALAREVRSRLRKQGITQGILTVFSPEAVPPGCIVPPDRDQGQTRSTVGSSAFLPAVFGLYLAAAAVNRLLGNREFQPGK